MSSSSSGNKTIQGVLSFGQKSSGSSSGKLAAGLTEKDINARLKNPVKWQKKTYERSMPQPSSDGKSFKTNAAPHNHGAGVHRQVQTLESLKSWSEKSVCTLGRFDAR